MAILALACHGSHPELPEVGGDAPDTARIPWIRRVAMDRVIDYRVWSGARAGFVALVARGGRLAYGYTSGWADVEAATLMALDTRFQIASMTKPITAVAAMILVEEGRLALDDPVARYLPSFRDQRAVSGRSEAGSWTTEPLPEPIRVRHLLTFTSGIGGYAESDDPLDRAWRARQIEAPGLGSLADRIERIPGLPLYERPGARWRYGWSADVLARVVEVAAGEPFDAFLQRRLFDPLGMDSTGFPDAQPPGVPFARMYTHSENGSLIREPRFDSDYGRGWTPGGGGLVSTAPDYMRFALMLAKGGALGDIRVLEPSTIAEMTRLHVPSGVLEEMEIEGLGWGLGLCVVADAESTPMRDYDGDYWWSGRFGTQFWVSPETETVVVVMQQTERNEFSGLPITPALIQGLAMP
ncbi:MAG: beta-lactamase family protein [Deltaproteobacteria bacterium]|jgi:CubicO group peptidase (beta-lactamase class C family)|nr:beta-lactamase family protein [Deltaproteobacteria bacterium]MBW2497635.1 beta-lactamase family protein [Deltaproteobacteria bacterium]